MSTETDAKAKTTKELREAADSIWDYVHGIHKQTDEFLREETVANFLESFVRPLLEPRDAEIADLKAEQEEYQEQFRQIMQEECPTDEVHCTCVPHLRMQLADREAENVKAKLDALRTAAQKMCPACYGNDAWLNASKTWVHTAYGNETIDCAAYGVREMIAEIQREKPWTRPKSNCGKRLLMTLQEQWF